jgi:hypothetical protein
MSKREIEDILHFRTDISPFLVHLTRDLGALTAPAALYSIIDDGCLKCSLNPISDVRFGIHFSEVNDLTADGFFSAICFTETPLNEIHSLLEIENRQIDLAPYGLVFLKENLANKGVSPVLYINNKNGDKDPVFVALGSLTSSHRDEALELLPLFAVYGKKIKGVGAGRHSPGKNEFIWEREWRYPFVKGDLEFSEEDVFIGLCPHEQIDDFEGLCSNIKFVDPTRNMKWYADKLIESRKRLGIKYSVI